MRTVRCLCTALSVAHTGALLLPGSETEPQDKVGIPHFDSFLQSFGRAYKAGSAEYKLRRQLYERRVAAAEQQNRRPDALWTAGVSFLWDYTDKEFASLRGWQRNARPGHDGEGSPSQGVGLVQASQKPLPEAIMWSHLVTFSSVPDQGACGSCWAIAGARVLQAHTEIHTKKIRTFSAQQLVSCVQNPRHCGGEGGCQGATVELAYAWVMQHGLANNTAAPYFGNNSACTAPAQGALTLASSNSSKSPRASGPAAFGMTGWQRLPENKYEPLIRALVERGPVAVSASGSAWGIYQTGIFDGCQKDIVIDHAVVMIGFGAVRNKTTNVLTKFWKIQNSWGPFWGEAGHIRMLRHDDEQYCGVNDEPEKGTGCIGGPEQVTVCGMCGILYDSVVPFF